MGAMTYGVVVTVPAPVSSYAALHNEVLKALGDTPADGLLVHVAREVDGGYQVLEVWESAEHSSRFNASVVATAMDRVPPEVLAMAGVPVVEEFEVHGLVVGSPDATGVARS
jgi:hypothetical protein